MLYYATRLSDHISETPEGFLVCQDVPIARAGRLEYNPDETPITPGSGNTIIHRTADVVCAQETIASFEGKPVTLQHPDDFVSPENWQKLAVGTVQNVRPGSGQQAGMLLADLLITDAKAIAEVRSGRLREVSCGYEAEYIEDSPGFGRQEKIRGNHVALVHSGRCGSECAIHDHAPTEKESTFMSVKKRLMHMIGRAVDENLPDSDVPIVDTTEEVMVDTGEEVMLDADEVVSVEELTPVDETSVDEGGDDIIARLDRIEQKLDQLLGVEVIDNTEEVILDEEQAKDACEEKMTDEEVQSRAEILAPGIAKTGDVKAKALQAAYATKDGKEVIDRLTCGKRVITDVDGLFVAASELLRGKRRDTAFARVTIDSLPGIKQGAVTPEMLNQKYAEHFARKG